MRRQYERQSVRTFYVGNATTPAELTDVANVLRTVFEMTIVAVAPRPKTLTPKTPPPHPEAPPPHNPKPNSRPPAHTPTPPQPSTPPTQTNTLPHPPPT